MSGIGVIEPEKFNYVVTKLRKFFTEKGFVEAHTQNRLSILSACEEPKNITTYIFSDTKWPMIQTGQMTLEELIMKNSKYTGLFCVTTSYRNEPNPIPGRHDKVFPMFEFEMKGDINELYKLECELLEYLGYGKKDEFPKGNYVDVAKNYNTRELEHEHEQKLYEEKGNAFFLMNFPEYTSPFWNMKRNNETKTANKIDVILSGMETIGSAERSCDVEEMRNCFLNISNGEYANALYGHFGKDRVNVELDEFLSLKFFTRSGGGIGLTRLIRSMEMEKLLPEF